MGGLDTNKMRPTVVIEPIEIIVNCDVIKDRVERLKCLVQAGLLIAEIACDELRDYHGIEYKPCSELCGRVISGDDGDGSTEGGPHGEPLREAGAGDREEREAPQGCTTDGEERNREEA